MVIGLTPTTDGLGSRTRILAGPPIITVAGRISQTMGGLGFPETIWTGALHGFPGGQAAIMLAGRLYLRAVRELFMRGGQSVLR